MKLRLIDRERFTDEEWDRARRGLCTEVIAYGMPWTEHCPKPLDPNSCYAACTEHDRSWVEEYGGDSEAQYRRDRATATEVEL